MHSAMLPDKLSSFQIKDNIKRLQQSCMSLNPLPNDVYHPLTFYQVQGLICYHQNV